MAQHLVKCKYCGKQFDTNLEQAIKIKSRYAHIECKPDDLKETDYELVPLQAPLDPEFIHIKDFINDRMKDHANWPVIVKQLQNIKNKNNFSYSGIYKTLVYYYDVKKQSIPGNYNILGIVPYYYKPAFDYYYSLYIISQQAKELENQEEVIKEIEIPIPKINKKIKMFDMGDEEEKDE